MSHRAFSEPESATPVGGRSSKAKTADAGAAVTKWRAGWWARRDGKSERRRGSEKNERSTYQSSDSTEQDVETDMYFSAFPGPFPGPFSPCPGLFRVV